MNEEPQNGGLGGDQPSAPVPQPPMPGGDQGGMPTPGGDNPTPPTPAPQDPGLGGQPAPGAGDEPHGDDKM